MSELHLYDFDGTLFRSPHQPEVWEGRWWNDVQSLMPPCVPDKPGKDWWISSTVADARRSISDQDVLAVMATGREMASGLRFRIPELLKQQGLRFDEVHLAPSGRAIDFKKKLIVNLLRQHPAIDTVRIWDDRGSHIPEFARAAVSAGISPRNVFVTEVNARSKDPECTVEPKVVEPKSKPSYVGIFLSGSSRAALAHRFPFMFEKLEADHVTLSRNVTPQLMARVGERVDFRVVGYAHDDRVQAVVVDLPPGLSSDNAIPHVTISTESDVPPKESNTMLARTDIQPVSGMTLSGIIDVFPRSLTPSALRVATRYLQER